MNNKKVDSKDITSSKKEYDVHKNNEPLKDSNIYCNEDDEYSADNTPNTANVSSSSHTNRANLNTTLPSNIIDNKNRNANNIKTVDENIEVNDGPGPHHFVSKKSNNKEIGSVTSNTFGCSTLSSSSGNFKQSSSYNSNSEQGIQSTKNKIVSKTIYTPLKGVTGVTSVTAFPPQYPCFFCGNNYKTNIDFDMELHLIEKHKEQMLKIPIKGNLDKRSEYLVNLAKKKMRRGEITMEVERDNDYEL